MSLRGFATLNFWADDVADAVAWYTEFLGMEPLFTRPGADGRLSYAKYRVGEQAELAIGDRAYAPPGTAVERAARSCTGWSTTWRPPGSG